MLLVALLLFAAPVFAQGSFVPSDASMDPALNSGTSYSVAHRDSLRKGCIVVFTRNGSSVARRVVGLPGDKLLSQDSDFSLRRNSSWAFFSLYENKVVYISHTTPMNMKSPPVYLSDLAPYTKVLEISHNDHVAASSIPDSSYFVASDNSSFDDSSQWGTVHLKDITGVILPSEEE